jgi:hypothetical protein
MSVAVPTQVVSLSARAAAEIHKLCNESPAAAAEARIRSGTTVVVRGEGKVILEGEVVNRFPHLRRRLRIRFFDYHSAKHRVTSQFSREPSDWCEIGVVVGISTSI